LICSQCRKTENGLGRTAKTPNNAACKVAYDLPMTQKSFAWSRFTPAQIDLMERIALSGNALPYDKLDYRDLLAFEELRKLKFAEMRTVGRSKLATALTSKGLEARADAYRTDQIILRVTNPQIDLLRFLNDAPEGESVGQALDALEAPQNDICRRMALRGWVEWYEGWNGSHWARLTPDGREVVRAVDALDEAIKQMGEARRRGRLQ
jgi:hypothetical protein